MSVERHQVGLMCYLFKYRDKKNRLFLLFFLFLTMLTIYRITCISVRAVNQLISLPVVKYDY